MIDFLDFLDSYMSSIGGHYGIPCDQLKLVIVLLLGIPLGFLHNFISGPFLRNFYSFIFGALFQIFLYRTGFLLTLSISLSLYFMMFFLPRKNCGFIVFICSLAALSTIFFTYTKIYSVPHAVRMSNMQNLFFVFVQIEYE